MKAALDWEREGGEWPNHQASQFVEAGGLTWHVQRMGTGPELLLLHGTGASCHSWRAMMPLLATHFTLTVPDLSGHAFTAGRIRGGASIDGMANALEALLDTLAVSPALIAGHSAGVAIALHLAHQLDPALPVTGFAPAITPFPGLAAKLFPAMARMLFVNPLVPRVFAATARLPGETQRFLRRATGSDIAAENLACYQRLLGNHRHCEGALAMMANWDLDAFSATLPNICNPVLLVHGRLDKAVPTGAVEAAAARLPDCTLEIWPDLGHLAHEEAPEKAAGSVKRFARKQGILRTEETTS